MSLNKFTSDFQEQKWMNIRANSLSIGSSPCTLSTTQYTPTVTSVSGSTIGTSYPARFTSNGNSLFITGTVDLTSTIATVNQINIFVTIPPNMVFLFSNQTLIVSGYLTEQDNNALTNQGLISSGDWDANRVRLQIMYAKANSSVTAYRVRYNIQIHR
jgi:hypothetical protein